MSAQITVAGRTIHHPIDVLEEYAQRYRRTLAQYDNAKQASPDEITFQDVRATRVIASRISAEQASQIVERSETNRQLLKAIPADAHAQDADPGESDGLYDAMTALYQALQGTGIRDSKVSKVLHLKRPSLYPILDSSLARFYRQAAQEAAARYPRRGFRRMAWAAIRDDVISNQEGLATLRDAVADHESMRHQRVHELSDLRLLDILAWKAQHG